MQFAYDDHSSIPFKLVHLKPAKDDLGLETAHRHNFFQMFIFSHGGGKHLIDFDIHDVNPGEIHIVNPGTIHGLNRTENTKGYVLLFSRTFFDNQRPNNNLFLYRNDFKQVLQTQVDVYKRIVNRIKAIDEEQKENAENNQEAILALLRLIVIDIQRIVVFNNDSSEAQNSNYSRFVEVLERQFTQEHKVAYYAEVLNCSADKLNDDCKNDIGKTAGTIIQDRILHEAKRLLFHSDKSNKEVAFYLGYDDPSYFNRLFKSKIGSTPKAYRTQIREKYHENRE